MRLEHINLVVKDLNVSLNFYQAAFPHWKIRQRGKGVWNGVDRNWLHFGDDFHFITLNDNGSGENRDLTKYSIGLAHFAYVTQNLAQLIERMKKAGFELEKFGPQNPFRTNAYFIDPDGFEVEFVEYRSDLPHERNISEEN